MYNTHMFLCHSLVWNVFLLSPVFCQDKYLLWMYWEIEILNMFMCSPYLIKPVNAVSMVKDVRLCTYSIVRCTCDLVEYVWHPMYMWRHTVYYTNIHVCEQPCFTWNARRISQLWQCVNCPRVHEFSLHAPSMRQAPVSLLLIFYLWRKLFPTCR